jgi:hypothetical protein
MFSNIQVNISGIACTNVQFITAFNLSCEAPNYAGTKNPIVVTVDNLVSNDDVTLDYEGIDCLFTL